MGKNGDAARLARRKGGAAVTATKVTLKFVVLNDPPGDKVCTDVFPDTDEKMSKVRAFLAAEKSVPDSTMLQTYMKANGCPLKFSEVGPILKDIRRKLLDCATGNDVQCTDSAGRETIGVLKTYVAENKNWKLEVTVGPTKSFSFESTNDPKINLGENFVRWM